MQEPTQQEEKKQSLLKRIWESNVPLTPSFFALWIFFIALYTSLFYSHFTTFELVVVKEFIGALLTITATIFGFLGALIILQIQLFRGYDSDQYRIAIDYSYKLLELQGKGSNEPSNEKMQLEISKIMTAAASTIEEIQQSEKIFKKFSKILVFIFTLAIFLLIGSYAILSSNVPSYVIYSLCWFALMMILGAFIGFAYILLIVLR